MRSLRPLAALLALTACTRSGPTPEEEAQALQTDLHRAYALTRRMGRFGELALFEEEMEKIPCQPSLSATNRTCDVTLIGKGPVRLRVAEPWLDQGNVLRKDALISIEYTADCDNQRFDFKTVDNALPRGPTQDGVTVWENALVKVTHRRLPSTPQDRCTLTMEAAPALLERVARVGALAAR